MGRFFNAGLSVFRVDKTISVENYFNGHTITSSCAANDGKGIWCSTLESGFFYIPDVNSVKIGGENSMKFIEKIGENILLTPKSGVTQYYNTLTGELSEIGLDVLNSTEKYWKNDTLIITSASYISKFYLEKDELKCSQQNLPKIKINKAFKSDFSGSDFLLESRYLRTDSTILTANKLRYALPTSKIPDSFRFAAINSNGDIIFNCQKNYQGIVYAKDKSIHIFNENNLFGSLQLIRQLYFETPNEVKIVAQNGIFNFNIIDTSTLDTTFWSEYIRINRFKEQGNLRLVAAEDGVYSISSKAEAHQFLMPLYNRNDNWIYDIDLHNGFAYLATKSGVYKISLAGFAPKKLRAPHISSITIGEQKILNDSVSFLFEQGIIRLQWTNFQFHTKAPETFRWRFNENENWQMTENSELELSSLAPGKYSFELQTSNGNKEWSDSSNFYFIILPPWYQTTWFIITMIGLLGFSIYILFLLRFNYLKEKLDLREAALAAQNQALGAQLNPHFIFNSMNTVSSFIAQEDDTKALRYISKLSVMLRRIFANAQKSTISLAEELVSVRQYIEIEQLRFGEKLQFHLQNKSTKNLEEIEVPSMLIQPFIENSIKHAILKNENGGNIWLTIADGKDSIKVIIEDDGPGFTDSSLEARQNKGESSISAIQKRLKIIESLGQESAKMSVEQGSKGAKITLTFSIKNACA